MAGISGVVSYDKDGRPRQVIGINIDVTERKHAELALAERNAQLALAAKAARVGYYANYLKTGLIAVSEGYAAIHGLPEGTPPNDAERLATQSAPRRPCAI